MTDQTSQDRGAAFVARDLSSRSDEEDNSLLVERLKEGALARRVALYESGEFLDEAVFCNRLAADLHSVTKSTDEKRMFWIEGREGAHWYPSFFITAQCGRQALEKVSVALGDLAGDAKWHFFTSPRYSLDGTTPLVALALGQLERVLHLAHEYRERRAGR